MKNAMKETTYKALQVTSTAFESQSMIPSKYTCDGQNINPPLDIDHIPDHAKSLALIMDDPDAGGGMFVHWVVWNIPITLHLQEHSIPGTEGMNDSRRVHYGGPCPPSGTHRYFFKVYALDATLDLPPSTNK
ncbi:MAG TPA: YbhB/YbcL family Raf kinase inhibitor-like protein, partial [Saprospiraceae bacterium]|nr:YbhB/YbcL family Raf kinase inhibitor-like protein [Saprospiraceae bacterium]